MRRREKNIWRTVIVLIIFIILALLTMAWLYVKKAPHILSDSLAKRLKTTVEIESITFSWNQITLHGVKIDNIQNSILPHALRAKTIAIKAPLVNFLKNNVTIEEIAIDQIYLGLEFDDIKSPKGNWTRLIENLYTVIDTQDTIETARTVSIETLKLTNITSQVVYKTKPKKIHTLPLIDQMVFINITSHGGFPIDQITNSILGKMLLAIFQRENLQNMLKDLFNPKNTLKQLLSPFKLLLP